MSTSKHIILASSSPRRRELLKQIGLTFTTDPVDVDERIMPGEGAEVYVERVAVDKARKAVGRSRKGVVIAADTVVVVGDVVLGKPKDAGDAERMLVMLSGKVHQVVSGLAVMDTETGTTRSGSAVTSVWFRDLTLPEIRSYVESGEPMDKAGAYGIQARGALLVRKIEGCYFNIVGLPVSLLGEILRDLGMPLL